MSKIFELLGAFALGLMVMFVVYKYFIKDTPVVIDKANIPVEIEKAEAKPDTIYLPAPKVIKDTGTIEWYEERLLQAQKVVEQLKNIPPKIIESTPGLLWQKSVKTFHWDNELKFIRNNDWYVKSEVTAFSLMPIELYGNSIEVKWDAYFNKYYMPQVEQELYNRGIYGVLVGGAVLGSFLSGNEYLAGAGVLLGIEFTLDIFGIF